MGSKLELFSGPSRIAVHLRRVRTLRSWPWGGDTRVTWNLMLGLGFLACPRGISSSHNWEQYSEATDGGLHRVQASLHFGAH